MSQTEPYVISISRQIGCGGSYIGKRLASRLGILYVDREIITRAAQKLNVTEKEIIARNEKVTPLWRSMVEATLYGNPFGYVPPPLNVPSDKELYQAEAEIIQDIARQASVVIIGRAGYHTLRNHSRHLSVFLHADVAFREQRVQEIYHLSAAEARKQVQSTDSSRASYLHAKTGGDWVDARQYHLALDTGVLGLELVEEIIVTAVQARFLSDGSGAGAP